METNENFNFAKALAACTGSVQVTVCDDAKGATATYSRKDELKDLLAEVMVSVASRKKFLAKALESLQMIYSIEKNDRAAVVVAKEALKQTGYKRTDTMFATAQINALVAAEAELADTMAMVMDRKKFYNRSMVSLQNIYAVEKNVRGKLASLKQVAQ
jgi:ribosomal protein L18